MANKERFPASVSVSLLLTHGRSGRLFLTRHGVKAGEAESWGLIAGGVDKGENPWQAAVREAGEEANLDPQNIIFVRGRNQLDPHVVFVPGVDKDHLGLVFDTTYSGPKLPKSWDIADDHSVDQVKLFSWQQVLSLLEEPELIYRPEFNFPQLIRWILKEYPQNPHRIASIDCWLSNHQPNIPGLSKGDLRPANASRLSEIWNYLPPYNNWMGLPDIRGNPQRTNFARRRFYDQK